VKLQDVKFIFFLLLQLFRKSVQVPDNNGMLTVDWASVKRMISYLVRLQGTELSRRMVHLKFSAKSLQPPTTNLHIYVPP
jgi:hypothetical protein